LKINKLSMEEKKKHPMQAVSKQTGLSPHVIRVWEKRYQAVSPERSETKRRFYSDFEVERLQLLKKLTDGKYRISKVAQLPLEELRKISSLTEAELTPPLVVSPWKISSKIFDNCLSAVETLDTRKLGVLIGRASLSLSTLTFLKDFIAPLLQELWRRERTGRLRSVQAQAGWLVVRSFLVNLANIYDIPDNAPLLVVAGPVGQYLEWGSLFTLTAAAAGGWKGIYFGVNLPAAEIAAGVSQVGAKLVVLSLASTQTDLILERELQRLAQLLPGKTPILAFGEGLGEWEPFLSKFGVLPFSSFSELWDKLGETYPEIS
jgi:MerR family transcriptional regulator, light-induced transcriptional regulator